MVFLKILCILCAIYALFAAFSRLLGWSHRYGWKFLITKTESMLSGKLLSQYRLCRVFVDFLSAGWCVLCFFDPNPTVRRLSFILITALAATTENYFSKIAKGG